MRTRSTRTAPDTPFTTQLARPLSHSISHGMLHVVLILLGVTTLIPFVYMVGTSVKSQAEVFSAVPLLLPKGEWQWQNYAKVSEFLPFERFYFNTIIVTVFRVIGQLLLCSLAGYAFARLRFPGRNLIFLSVLAALMVPSQITVIPNYILLKYLKWLDTYQGLIIPSLFSAFGTFLLRQFFLTVPQDLEDAATIDGCNPLQTYWHVALPLAGSIMAAFGVLVVQWSWNDFLWPLIITSSTDMQMLSVGIAYFQTERITNYGVMMAAATLSTVPMVIIFLFAQRYLIEGITMSGLKL